MLGAQDTHLELAHSNKAVVVSMGEIHKPHRRAFLTGPAVLADAGILQQHGENVAVVLNQARTGEACGKLLDHLIHLIIFHPVVDDLELLPQHRQHDHFGKALPKGVAGVLLAVEVDDLPSPSREAGREEASRRGYARRV